MLLKQYLYFTLRLIHSVKLIKTLYRVLRRHRKGMDNAVEIANLCL